MDPDRILHLADHNQRVCGWAHDPVTNETVFALSRWISDSVTEVTFEFRPSREQHTLSCNAHWNAETMTLSPDGQLFAYVDSPDHHINVHNTYTGAQTADLFPPDIGDYAMPYELITSLSWMPATRKLFVCKSHPIYGANFFNAAPNDDAEEPQLTHTSTLSVIDFSAAQPTEKTVWQGPLNIDKICVSPRAKVALRTGRVVTILIPHEDGDSNYTEQATEDPGQGYQPDRNAYFRQGWFFSWQPHPSHAGHELMAISSHLAIEIYRVSDAPKQQEMPARQHYFTQYMADRFDSSVHDSFGQLAWSPNGRQLAVLKNEVDVGQLAYVLPASDLGGGGNSICYDENEFSDGGAIDRCNFFWAPTGKQLAITEADSSGRYPDNAPSDSITFATLCPYSDRDHHLFGAALRRTVMQLMLVRHRLNRTGQLRLLPMEIWLLIFSFLPRTW